MASETPFSERITCTINDACTNTGLGPTKLYEMIGAGAIESVKVGKRRLVVVRSLLKILDPKRIQDAA